MGAAVLMLDLRRVSYDYFVRLHDCSHLIAFGSLGAYVGAVEGGTSGAPVLLGGVDGADVSAQAERVREAYRAACIKAF
eukprot:6769979-Prymnesium_polylepis.1